MPHAVTHVLLTIILVDLFRDYFMKKKHHKKYLTMHTLFIAGIGALLPDIDIVIRWFFYMTGRTYDIFTHGGIFHTPIFALIFLIPGLILWKNKKHELAMYCFVLAFGIFFHIFLDYFLGGGSHDGIMWLWPFSIVRWKIHLLSNFGAKDIPMAIDAVLLLGWLWHEEVKHKIKDFI